MLKEGPLGSLPREAGECPRNRGRRGSTARNPMQVWIVFTETYCRHNNRPMRRMNDFARLLRKNPTDAERLLWSKLRRRQLGQFKFRRQRPIGPYICDFVCVEAQVIIELDGTFVLPLRRGLPRHLPRVACLDRGHGEQVFGDMVNTPREWSHEVSDAVPREGRGARGAMSPSAVGGGEPAGAVPPVQYSAAYFVQVAGSVPAGRCSGVVGPLPSTASQSVSDES